MLRFRRESQQPRHPRAKPTLRAGPVVYHASVTGCVSQLPLEAGLASSILDWPVRTIPTRHQGMQADKPFVGAAGEIRWDAVAAAGHNETTCVLSTPVFPTLCTHAFPCNRGHVSWGLVPPCVADHFPLRLHFMRAHRSGPVHDVVAASFDLIWGRQHKARGFRRSLGAQFAGGLEEPWCFGVTEGGGDGRMIASLESHS